MEDLGKKTFGEFLGELRRLRGELKVVCDNFAVEVEHYERLIRRMELMDKVLGGSFDGDATLGKKFDCGYLEHLGDVLVSAKFYIKHPDVSMHVIKQQVLRETDPMKLKKLAMIYDNSES